MFSPNLSVLSLFPSPQLQFLSEEEILEKTEAWALKYQYAHPVWFGSFSAFLVVSNPEYAKAIFARGGKRQWFNCGAAATDCSFPMPGWQFSARQGVTNRSY